MKSVFKCEGIEKVIHYEKWFEKLNLGCLYSGSFICYITVLSAVRPQNAKVFILTNLPICVT